MYIFMNIFQSLGNALSRPAAGRCNLQDKAERPYIHILYVYIYVFVKVRFVHAYRLGSRQHACYWCFFYVSTVSDFILISHATKRP